MSRRKTCRRCHMKLCEGAYSKDGLCKYCIEKQELEEQQKKNTADIEGFKLILKVLGWTALVSFIMFCLTGGTDYPVFGPTGAVYSGLATFFAWICGLSVLGLIICFSSGGRSTMSEDDKTRAYNAVGQAFIYKKLDDIEKRMNDKK